MSQKEKIFTLLKEADEVLSGEKISSILGISRVSVWKHVKGMVQANIPIVSSPQGYRLMPDPDSLLSWEFGVWQDRIHLFQELSSTMDEATTLARQGCPAFSAVVAERQTQGRGRMQRVWASDEGGLYFSVIVRPDVPIMLASLVNLAAAVEMTDLLRSNYHVQATLKWPNDILVNDLKICGVLSQMDTDGDQIGNIRIGVGLNVNNDPEQEEYAAVSLQRLVGRQVPRREILIAFLSKFEQRLMNFEPQTLIDNWKANNATIGRHVRVSTLKKTIEGRAIDIDSHGGLILQMADGRYETAIHGDCFHN